MHVSVQKYEKLSLNYPCYPLSAALIDQYPQCGAGLVAQQVACLTQEPEALGSIPGPAIYFRFFLHLFKEGSCHLLAKECE